MFKDLNQKIIESANRSALNTELGQLKRIASALERIATCLENNSQ